MTPTEAVTSLVAMGWTEAYIADAVQSKQTTINRIKKGGGCRYDLGARIVSLCDAEIAKLLRLTK